MNAVSTITQSTALGTVSQRALQYMQANREMSNELSAGITGGFAVVAFKGKVWSLKFAGENRIFERVDPETGETVARQSIEVILVRSASAISKNFYEKGYVEGSSEAPDCYSTNGIAPEPASPKRQNQICATCRHNQFGSRVSQDGTGRGKACADSKRIAIVPAGDIDNEAFGGPMLIRIPAASLRDLKAYADTLERNGYPFFAVATRLSFDSKEAYPKIVMKGIRALTEEETAQVIALRDDPRTMRILESSDEHAAAAPAEEAAPPEPLFEQMPAAAAPAPQPAPAPAPAPVKQSAPPVAEVAPTPAPTPALAPAPVQPAPAAVAPAPAPQEAPPVQAAPTPAPAQAAEAPASFDEMFDSLLG